VTLSDLSPWLVAGAAVALLCVALLLLRLSSPVLLAVYAFVLPWGSAVPVPGPPAPFDTFSTLVGLAATAGLTLRLVRTWRAVRVPPAWVALWLVLLGWLALTLLWSVDPERSARSLAVLASLMALYVVASLSRLEPRELRWIELAAVGGGLVVCGQALAATFRGGGVSQRFTFEDGDPNITAATLLLPLALAAWWALNTRSRSRRGLAGAASFALISGIMVTGSRGGLVSALVVLLVVLGMSRRVPVVRAAAYGGVFLSVAAVLLVSIPEGLQARLLKTDSTGRSDIWLIGLDACLTRCGVGSGYGTFGAVYRETYLSELSLTGFGDRFYAAHNIFLSIVVEAGLPGLLLLLSALLLMVRALWHRPRPLAGPALAATAGLVASNMLLSNLGFKYFWLTLLYATLVVTTQRASEGPSAGRERPVGRAASPVPS
jgi:O-antigen ligase